MSEVSILSGSIQGFASLVLRTPRLELECVPSLGGRVVRLFDRRSGREWLWHRDSARWLWESRPGSSFGEGPQAGLDECLPSVSACRVDGLAIPDHGDLWFQSWRVEETLLSAGVLSLGVQAHSMPFLFSRSISALDDHTLEFRYRLENVGDRELPYLWCLHPLFAIHSGDRIDLPAEVASLRLNGGLGVPIAFGERWSYPEPFPRVRLDLLQCPGGDGACVKGFAGPLLEGRAALVNDNTGDRLELTWDARELPLLGLWLNRGLAGFHHVAIEPCSGAPDSLSDAIEHWKCFSTIGAHSVREWSLRWTLAA